jgi:hypothetical protein
MGAVLDATGAGHNWVSMVAVGDAWRKKGQQIHNQQAQDEA